MFPQWQKSSQHTARAPYNCVLEIDVKKEEKRIFPADNHNNSARLAHIREIFHPPGSYWSKMYINKKKDMEMEDNFYVGAFFQTCKVSALRAIGIDSSVIYFVTSTMLYVYCIYGGRRKKGSSDDHGNFTVLWEKRRKAITRVIRQPREKFEAFYFRVTRTKLSWLLVVVIA